VVDVERLLHASSRRLEMHISRILCGLAFAYTWTDAFAISKAANSVSPAVLSVTTDLLDAGRTFAKA
jgi:hypothetical protein